MPRPATLALEDGTILDGQSFGADGEVCAEVVFNTSLTGYQEVITDPSYRGQMVTFTCPHIGNVGVNEQDNESPRAQCSAIIAREIESKPSNWRATKSLPEWLREQNVIAIGGVDTRWLTRHLRDGGVMKGVASTLAGDPQDLVRKARMWEGLDGRDLVREVTCNQPYSWNVEGATEFGPQAGPMTHRVITNRKRTHVVVYDFGVKQNILRRLVSHGCRVSVVPASFPAREAMSLKPDGIVFSNGPGDPAALPYAVSAVRELLDNRIPMFGICLGHQLLGIALGGRTYKLKFGHHGENHPVIHLETGCVSITAQNHNYGVDAKSLDPAQVEITHTSLNDGCVEGLRVKDAPVFSVQYHPEASPGPHDSDGLFSRFINSITT